MFDAADLIPEVDLLQPEWLYLLLLLPIVWWISRTRLSQSQPDHLFTGYSADLNQLRDKNRWIPQVRKLILFVDLSAAGLMILALARPLSKSHESYIQEQYKNGIDIMLAIDVSASMLAMDFEPNRLEAAKTVAKEFIEGRKGDRIGLVVYAGEAYTSCPTTLDYKTLIEQIDRLGMDQLENGTAIGTGLGTAVARLRDDNLPSKVIILLTDGSNNAGQIQPQTAAELAKAKNIRVYTIGVGSNGEAPTPVITPFGIRYENMPVEIDEETLKSIAKTAGGNYYRATDEQSLRNIYQEIDQLEKRKQSDKQLKVDPPHAPISLLVISLILIAGSFMLKNTFFPIHYD